jgi:hypothetical protein
MIRENNFERSVKAFVQENRIVAKRTYITDYSVQKRHAQISVSGEPLTDEARTALLNNASKYRIKPERISITEHTFGMSQSEMDNLLEEIYTRTDTEIEENAALIAAMQSRLDQLSAEIEILREQVTDPAPVEPIYPEEEQNIFADSE